jgi:hypothetical protein
MSTVPKQPRQGHESIGGIQWLARMTDKAYLDSVIDLEAVLDLAYPCPMDQRLLSQLAISAEVFQTIAVKHHDNNDELVAALKAAGAKI